MPVPGLNESIVNEGTPFFIAKTHRTASKRLDVSSCKRATVTWDIILIIKIVEDGFDGSNLLDTGEPRVAL